jgi:hypothetical protein
MPKTMQIIIDRANNPKSDDDALIVAGELADLRIAKEALSLRASKLLHLLVQSAAADAADDVQHSMTIAALNEKFHLPGEEFITLARELAMTGVETRYRNEAGNWSWRFGTLLSDIQREIGDTVTGDPALVKWRFSPLMQLVLADSDHWAQLSRRAVLAFESRYSLRLYEIVTLRSRLKHKSHERFDLDALRLALGVKPDKLVQWAHFRTRCLDVALAEVVQLSGLKVWYEPVKLRGKTVAIDLFWAPPTKAGADAAVKELENSRVGRKARRAGTVEAIITEEAIAAPAPIAFPKFGTLNGTGFDVIARASLKPPIRNLDLVRDDFVKWAESKGIPLKGDAVLNVFRGFCERQDPAP